MAARRKITSNKFIFSLLFEQGLNQLELQSQAVESIEAKTGYLMAGEGVLLTIFVTLATQAKPLQVNTDIFIGILGLLVSLGLCIGTLWNRHLHIGLGIEDFYQAYINKTQEEIRFRALNIINYGYNVNRNQLTKKSILFQGALITFGLSLLFLVNGFFIDYLWYTKDMDNTKSSNTQTIQQQNSNVIAQTEHPTEEEQNRNWRWAPASQNLGTIAADVVNGNEESQKK